MTIKLTFKFGNNDNIRFIEYILLLVSAIYHLE